MLITILVFIAIGAVGMLAFAASKPEAVVVRECGRAILWASLFGLVFLIAREMPAAIR